MQRGGTTHQKYPNGHLLSSLNVFRKTVNPWAYTVGWMRLPRVYTVYVNIIDFTARDEHGHRNSMRREF